ncbi:MAG: universal stress protein [Acidimicrobiaceae bacterium]|nr:universal stress protein [Acidimicrobiaceae bacterium]
MYSCVVVGTDGSQTADKAVEVAAELAREWKAAFHAVTAFRSGTRGLGAASGADLVGGGGVLARDAAEEVAQRAADKAGLGAGAHAHAVDKPPADAILATAEAVNADVVVVGSKGMRGAGRVLGSVPNSVAHGASCAVLIVKTD